MSVPPIQLAALDWAAAAAGTLAEPWKVGSVVSGRVLEYLTESRMILKISGHTIEANPPSGGLVPRQFQAKVVRGGANPVLELLGQINKTPPTASALRARLPLQNGLQPLLADLKALPHAAGARKLPEPVRVALARLEASIVDRHDILDPDVLRDTVRRAGLQLEHSLLERANVPTRMPTAPVDYDLKAALQRLTQALKQLPQDPVPEQPRAQAPSPTPAATSTQAAAARAYAPAAASAPIPLPVPAKAEIQPPLLNLPLQPQARVPAPFSADALILATGMLQHAQAALSRIEIMQLEAHPSASPQAWMVEIPVQGDDGFDVLQVRFEQEAPDERAPNSPQWTLGFTIDPPRIGAIHGRIRLRGAKVNVDLWAQHDATVTALEEQNSVLSRLLEGSGLELVQLRVRQGTPLRHTGLGRSLLEASA